MTECEVNLMEATHTRLSNVEQSVHRIETKVDDGQRAVHTRLDGIAESLRILARLEERHEHVNQRLTEGAKSMGEHRERTSELERRVATLEGDSRQFKELRAVINKIGMTVILAVVVAVIALVVKT